MKNTIKLNNSFIEEIKSSMVEWRRFIHQNAELGDYMPKTVKYVTSQLEGFGYKVEKCSEYGLLCSLEGEKKGKTLLLRADMDALPMTEDNDLIFKSQNEGISHCCGHDLHTSILLGVAKTLMENKHLLSGKVIFMFQPNEEAGTGAMEMLKAGLLDNKNVDAAFALHVDAMSPLNKINYGYGATFASNDNLEIVIKGKSSHGARPHQGIDPINIAFQLYSLFNAYITREENPLESVIFSITSIVSGNSFNIIPSECIIKCSLRTYNTQIRDNALNRLNDIIVNLSNLYKTEINLNTFNSIPSLYTNEEFTEKIKNTIASSLGEKYIGSKTIKLGSEDFAFISQKIDQNAYFFIGAGKNENEGYEYGQHSDKVIFNENCMVTALTFVYQFVREYLV